MFAKNAKTIKDSDDASADGQKAVVYTTMSSLMEVPTKFSKHGVEPMFCDACGDIVKAAYPVKIIFPHGSSMTLLVCLDCYESGHPLEIDVKRKEQVSRLITQVKKGGREQWRKRI